jgi:hypothetical protein
MYYLQSSPLISSCKDCLYSHDFKCCFSLCLVSSFYIYHLVHSLYTQLSHRSASFWFQFHFCFGYSFFLHLNQMVKPLRPVSESSCNIYISTLFLTFTLLNQCILFTLDHESINLKIQYGMHHKILKNSISNKLFP